MTWQYGLLFEAKHLHLKVRLSLHKQQNPLSGCFCGMAERYLITGGTGLIGEALTSHLLQRGHEVHVLSRTSRPSNRSNLRFFEWNPAAGNIDMRAFESIDSVIHLAGAPVAQRWTPAHKDRILTSRLESAATLIQAIAALPSEDRPKSCVSASAIGLYRDSDAWQTEEDAPADGFLSEVVQSWESSVEQLPSLGVRMVKLRIGLVLTKNGGMLGKLLPVFRWGLGAAVGNGQHWQSWIHVSDVVRMMEWAAQNTEVSGTFNAVAPNPVSNDALSRAIAAACKRPYWAPNVPAWALKFAYGEMASVVLASQKVDCSKVQEAGYTFEFNDVQSALIDVIR